MLPVMAPAIAQMKSGQQGLSVISSNISNLNVISGRGSYVNYIDTAGTTIKAAQAPTATMGGTNPITLGVGCAIGSVNVNPQSGALNPTGNKYDLAIEGNGYFMYSTGSGTAYSRDGTISQDAGGYLYHSSTGNRLLGWKANNIGVVDTNNPIAFDSYINVPVGEGAAQRTENAIMKGNLAPGAAAGDVFLSKFEAFDSLGNRRMIQITVTDHTNTVGAVAGNITVAQNGAGATSKWTWTAHQVNADGTLTPLTISANHDLFFRTNGDMITDVGNGMLSTGTIALPALNGSAPATFNINFSNINQVGLSSKIDLQTQDGYPAGALSSYDLSSDGTITGTFGIGGFKRKLGQIGVSTFANPSGLDRLGNNMWGANNNSGTAVVGVASTNDKGAIKSGFLEMSNVDMGEQFVRLIIEERTMQANMKIITAVDEISHDLINVKH